VDFSEERKRFGLGTIVCRIVVHVNGRRTPVLSAHERGADAQSALDLALDKIDRQVVKLKEMRTHRHLEVSPVRVPIRQKSSQPRDSEPERIRLKLMPESLEQAIDEIAALRDHYHSDVRVLGDGEPKIGAHGKPVLFLHPKDFLGTLVELEQA